MLWNETQGFEYYEEIKRLERGNQMEQTLATFTSDENDALASAQVSSTAVVAASKYPVATHRTAQTRVLPLVFETPLQDITTTHQVELLAVLLTQVRHDKPNMSGAGPNSRELEVRYLQKFTLNALLAEGDTTHDWGYGLRGKLDLKGIIDANTIVKHYSKMEPRQPGDDWNLTATLRLQVTRYPLGALSNYVTKRAEMKLEATCL